MAKLEIGKSLVPAMDDYYNYDFKKARLEAGYSVKQLAEKVGVSTSLISHYERLRGLPNPRVARRLAKVLHRKPSELFPKQLREYVREIQRERRGNPDDVLDYAVSLEDGLGFQVKDSSEQTLPVIAGREELQRRLQKVFKTLSDRERKIIELRYGFCDGYSYTYKEIGCVFKVTGERVKQIEARAIRKLQRPSRSQELAGFLD